MNLQFIDWDYGIERPIIVYKCKNKIDFLLSFSLNESMGLIGNCHLTRVKRSQTFSEERPKKIELINSSSTIIDRISSIFRKDNKTENSKSLPNLSDSSNAIENTITQPILPNNLNNLNIEMTKIKSNIPKLNIDNSLINRTNVISLTPRGEGRARSTSPVKNPRLHNEIPKSPSIPDINVVETDKSMTRSNSSLISIDNRSFSEQLYNPIPIYKIDPARIDRKQILVPRFIADTFSYTIDWFEFYSYWQPSHLCAYLNRLVKILTTDFKSLQADSNDEFFVLTYQIILLADEIIRWLDTNKNLDFTTRIYIV